MKFKINWPIGFLEMYVVINGRDSNISDIG